MYRFDVVFKPKCQPDPAILEKTEQSILGLWEAREQIDCLRQYRLTDEKRGIKFGDSFGRP
jgi:hypothetical protein